MLKILILANAPYVKSGYGVANRHLMNIFRNLGHDVSCLAFFGAEGDTLMWNGFPIYPRGHEAFGNDVIDMHSVHFGADLVVSLVDVHVLDQYGRKHFAWLPITPVDGDPITDRMGHALAGAVDIVAISEYGRQTLERAGFPATTIRLPVDTVFYHPTDKIEMRKRFGWDDKWYIVGHVGMNRGFRKGHDLLLQAFQIVLGEIPDARLYLHLDTNQPDGLNLRKCIKELGIENYVMTPLRGDAFYGKPEIYMRGLYNCFDLYAQPSLNEGQAMPLYEAYSCGLPVIATAATALTEGLEDADAIALEPGNRIWLPSEQWGYEPRIDDIANAIINAYRKWGRNYISLANREKAINTVSLNVVGAEWQEELSKVEKRIRFTPIVRPWKEKPHIVHVSTDVNNCGIAAYTKSLMMGMENNTDSSLVNIRELREASQIPDCDILHLHYEAAISPPEQIIKNILQEVHQRGTKVMCTYHSIFPDLVNEQITKGFVDLGVIHWPFGAMEVDPNKIAILGGMGVPWYQVPNISKRNDYRAELGLPIDGKIISTFGFAAAGRGHYEVLQALAPYMQMDRTLHCQLLLPENFLNSGGFQIVHTKIKEIAQTFGIEKQISAIPDFLSNLEVLKRLWVSDAGFLYLDFDTYSTSSAARYFVSVRLPLVITDSTHFGDLRRGVVKTEKKIGSFVEGILRLLPDEMLRKRLIAEHEETYNEFVWPVFTEKYMDLYRKVLRR